MNRHNSISRRSMLAASVAAALGSALPVTHEASGIDFGSGLDFAFIAYIDKNGKVTGARFVRNSDPVSGDLAAMGGVNGN